MDTDATPPPAGGSAFQDASLGQRVGGFLLDNLVVLLPLFLISGLIFGETQTGGSRFEISLTGVPFVLTVLVALAYFIGMELTQGQTLGKRIVGIRVVSEKGDLGAGPVVIRNLLRVIDGFLCYLVGFFVALASKKNQRIGDMAASTRVVRAR